MDCINKYLQKKLLYRKNAKITKIKTKTKKKKDWMNLHKIYLIIYRNKFVYKWDFFFQNVKL